MARLVCTTPENGEQMPDLKYKSGGLPLPPYGMMTEGLQEILTTGPDVPAAFHPNESQSLRTRKWVLWRDETKRLITETLWPEWDAENQVWIGSAVGQMYDITAADLDIIQDLKANVLRSKPSTPFADPARPRHIDFFRAEDDGVLFSQYQFYDTTLQPAMIDHFRDAFDATANDKFGTVHLQFKQILQRPRPFQTVFLTKHAPFNPLRSISAGTPSICSGHSFQAVTGIGAVIERLLLEAAQLSPGSWCALRQHTVDIGDRRVFAGLHYPSDNIASWIIAMRLADLVFPNSEVKVHLWKAISQQSRVYREVSNVRIYEAALAHLRTAAANVQDRANATPSC
jgi:hypothetical protein